MHGVRLLSPAPRAYRSRRHSSVNRVSGFEPQGRIFESCWRRQRGCSDRAGAARADAHPVGIGKEVGSTPAIGSTFFHITNTHHQSTPRPDVVGYRLATGSGHAARNGAGALSHPRQRFRPGACAVCTAKDALVMRHDGKRAGSPGPTAVGYLVNSGSIPATRRLRAGWFQSPRQSLCPCSAVRATSRTRPHQDRSRVRRAGGRGLSTWDRSHPRYETRPSFTSGEVRAGRIGLSPLAQDAGSNPATRTSRV